VAHKSDAFPLSSSRHVPPIHCQFEDAGGLKLIYIDPPFDVGPMTIAMLMKNTLQAARQIGA